MRGAAWEKPAPCPGSWVPAWTVSGMRCSPRKPGAVQITFLVSVADDDPEAFVEHRLLADLSPPSVSLRLSQSVRSVAGIQRNRRCPTEGFFVAADEMGQRQSQGNHLHRLLVGWGSDAAPITGGKSAVATAQAFHKLCNLEFLQVNHVIGGACSMDYLFWVRSPCPFSSLPA
jgi:hypothetical protein